MPPDEGCSVLAPRLDPGPQKRNPECLGALRGVERDSIDTGNRRLAREVLTTDQAEAHERSAKQECHSGGFRCGGGFDGAGQADPIPGTTGLSQVHNQRGGVVAVDPHGVVESAIGGDANGVWGTAERR